MTDQYYILEKGQKLGPFTRRELTERPLESNDMVMSPRQTDWKEAHLLDEFNDYFKSEGIYYPTKENTAFGILRLPAYFIDGIIILFTLSVASALLFPDFVKRMTGIFTIDLMRSPEYLKTIEKHQNEIILMQLVIFFVTVLYNAACESSVLRGSIGKYILGLSVVDELGYGITFPQALGRNMGKSIYEFGSLIIGFIAYLAYLSMFWTPLHQAPHDRLTRCFVVKKSI